MTFGTDILKQFMRLYERRLEPEYLRMLAEGYWRTLLVLALGALVGLLFFGLWQFLAVLEDLSGAQNTNVAKPPLALSRNALESALAAFDARKDAYENAGSGTTFKDPSK